MFYGVDSGKNGLNDNPNFGTMLFISFIYYFSFFENFWKFNFLTNNTKISKANTTFWPYPVYGTLCNKNYISFMLNVCFYRRVKADVKQLLPLILLYRIDGTPCIHFEIKHLLLSIPTLQIDHCRLNER